MAPSLSRRSFVVGCSAAIAAMAGGKLGYVAFGQPEDSNEILVSIFLRGGCDGLNIVAPLDGTDRGLYEAARPRLKLPASGSGALLPLGTMTGATGGFGLNGAMAPLHELFQENKVAIVHAAGLTSNTRSHFDAMEFMERGTPEGYGAGLHTGWLTRHMASTGMPPNLVLPATAISSALPSSLLGSENAVAFTDPGAFDFYGHWRHEAEQRAALRAMYQSTNDWIHAAGLNALDALDVVEGRYDGTPYVPANGAVYPTGSFGDQLKVLARMIKWEIGMRVATLDFGGWDTHEYQGNGASGYLADQLGVLAQGLHALYTDLNGAGSQNYTSRLTVVVMSEFGRRLRENSSSGTDHGHGNLMLVVGGNVLGGLKGNWPGLETDQLYDNADLAITTDYRRILSEILIRRCANPNLGTVFPNYTNYTPLGVVSGADLPPIYQQPLDESVYLPLVVR